MNLKIVALLCCLIKADVLGKSVRVIGGTNTEIRHFPFMVSIRMVPINLHVCGGAIISQFHILSAAHCFYNKDDLIPSLRIYTGTSSSILTTAGPNFKIKDVFIHSDFTGIKTMRSMNRYDIAVLKVAEAIIFNEFQRKVSLPTSNISGGEIGLLIGWGSTAYPSDSMAQIIQKAPMAILSNSVCQLSFQFLIFDDQLCAFIKKDCGVCTGDSGGPLISDNKIVGIVSTSEPCATGIPDLYTRVYSHLDFIQSSMQK